MEHLLERVLEILENENINQIILEDENNLYKTKFIREDDYCLVFQDIEHESYIFKVWNNDIKDIYTNNNHVMKLVLYDVIGTIQD